MAGSYNPWLVFLSIVVATIASYVALDLASRVVAHGTRASRYWLFGGALSMGTGIWSMHFIGMLAFQLPIPMAFDIPITLLSLFIATIVSGFALYTVSHGTLSLRRLLSGGLLMGIGISCMHYTGMAAMELNPPIRYDPPLFAASIVIAIAASVAALWIAFQLRTETILSAFWKKAGSSLVMGIAITGMHYTGMAAANFAPNTVCSVNPQDINNVWLASVIGGFTFMFLATTLLISVFDSHLANRAAKHAENLRLVNVDLEKQATKLSQTNMQLQEEVRERKRAEVELRVAAIAFESQESMMITDANGVILRVNLAFTENTGYTAEEAVGQTPRLLKSGRHDLDFYRAMWEAIQRTGTWQGEIWDRRKNGEVYPEWLTISAVMGSDGVVTHYVGSHIDITKDKAAEETIKNLAFYDPLTGLPNRRLLIDRLHQAFASSARSGREGALLFIDLDNVKSLNDTLGHDIGDLLLQQTAQRLESCLREVDTVARLGGDEFVVMLEDLSEQPIEAATQTEAVGEKILAMLNQPYQLDTHEYHSTASIGAIIFSDHGQSGEELLKRADIAMYQAKKAGRNTLRFFDPKMQDILNARASLESELRKALENQQFHLYYQIQVDSSHRPLGAEALIRWLHPERGLVSPAQFIPLAEETGLILPIGQWVLETACTQLKAWEQEVLTRDLVLAVNVSAKQFHQADFVAQVQAVVQRLGINPMRLKLELTEGMLLENIEETIATMNALNKVGVQFSLDDFGTGYSSLQYLKRLPLDQLKIDQSFVRDIGTDSNDRAIVSAIIAMTQSMKLSVIAEGVETKEQRQFLLDEGCTHYQGYLFGKPVPIEQFEALLKHG